MIRKILVIFVLFFVYLNISYGYLSEEYKNKIDLILDNYYIKIEEEYSIINELSILNKINIKIFSLEKKYKGNIYKLKILVYIRESIMDRIEKVIEGIELSALNTVDNNCNNYLMHKGVVASVFWIGEISDSSNAYISNVSSAWDIDWLDHYNQGLENSFYIALPYNDFLNGVRKENSKRVPWYNTKEWKYNESIVKNRWVKIKYDGKVAYAQWEDVGPLLEDDFDYVFGKGEPKNTFSLEAGIDLSPDVANYLGIDGMGYVDWSFVNEDCVPDGEWKYVITDSNINWK